LDVLTKIYDVYIEGDKYYALPKFAVKQKNVKYEMRDIAELEKKMSQNSGQRFASSQMFVISMATFGTAAINRF
jgi:hypothetical protein